MYTLFGYKGSGSAAIELALERTLQPFRVCQAASWDPQSAIKELLAINPLGQIPTLQLHDGTVLTESAAILIHLGLNHPVSELLPADAADRAQVIRGLVYLAANCYAAIGVIDYPERWSTKHDEATLKAIRQGARDRLHHYWDLFADCFWREPYLSGPQLGALDLLAAVVSKWSGARPHIAASRPHLYKTLQKIEADEAVTRVFSQHW
ncbi:glutathione S-transferase family protein [Parachitinimonas caeni]|uniref:Glutathione S-transferase family protein n=1 Tax=Parachitinimonas caeni TaxID=3031301 RepID=A0ABT7E239_9NEIS|nr:glutathione S-transferase family protein [Parachitinimonas caeni]MDK2125408.1 glutathione S-transferase family protein [Parachitinimonas caeni]